MSHLLRDFYVCQVLIGLAVGTAVAAIARYKDCSNGACQNQRQAGDAFNSSLMLKNDLVGCSCSHSESHL